MRPERKEYKTLMKTALKKPANIKNRSEETLNCNTRQHITLSVFIEVIAKNKK